jgi:type VI secretion system protein ImpE
MNSKELFQAGRLGDAIQALGAELRDNPTDSRRRTFLFELLCFAGEYDRAEKHLGVLAQGGNEAELGALLYRSALAAERTRHELFQKNEYPRASLEGAEPAPISGTMNGQPFGSITDGDPRIGARLEVFAAGQYLWIPFQHIASIEIQAPRRLRDLLWAPALVRTGPGFKDKEIGEALVPVMAPFSWRHHDDAVRLGRLTVWEETADGETAPLGQKVLLVDDQDFPILEVRRIEFAAPEPATEQHASA